MWVRLLIVCFEFSVSLLAFCLLIPPMIRSGASRCPTVTDNWGALFEIVASYMEALLLSAYVFIIVLSPKGLNFF